MKQWENPKIQELDINATAYNPKGGFKKDGSYTSEDGLFNIPTYGLSTGNTGTPGVVVNK